MKIEFRKIDKSNYWECMTLTLDKSQERFVADNKQSLVEAAYEEGLYTLGIYHEETMVGFILYDYDDSFPGWSMSRFMIGEKFQGKGYGKQAVLDFIDYFRKKHHADKLYISVSLENTIARKMYSSIGFAEIKEVEYTFAGRHFREMQMVKELDMEYEIVMAAKEDRNEILSLYKAQIGREFCPWSEDYPSNEAIDWDLSRDALFVLKMDGSIKAAVSIEEDEEADLLSCWDATLAPAGELARLAVLPDEQNRGFGRIMLKFGMDELKRRGFQSVHILVNKYNTRAIHCYAVFGFRVAGECRMYEQDFLCYEKEL